MLEDLRSMNVRVLYVSTLILKKFLTPLQSLFAVPTSACEVACLDLFIFIVWLSQQTAAWSNECLVLGLYLTLFHEEIQFTCLVESSPTSCWVCPVYCLPRLAYWIIKSPWQIWQTWHTMLLGWLSQDKNQAGLQSDSGDNHSGVGLSHAYVVIKVQAPFFGRLPSGRCIAAGMKEYWTRSKRKRS